MKEYPVVIIGAGPAGLTAAYELVKRGIPPIVLEKSNQVGGLARTETYKGYRFDIGGHRFFTKTEEVQNSWREMLKEDFLRVPRLSRIHHQGKFFHYPLNLSNVLSHLGIVESLTILFSYGMAAIHPYPEEKTLEQWVINRFGSRLYKTFFKAYTEKVWGIPCDRIQADWAAQRIKGLSLISAVSNALYRNDGVKTLVHEFHYPVYGTGMMWQRFQKIVESLDGEVCLETEVVGLKCEDDRIKSIVARKAGRFIEVPGDHYLSTIPLVELITCLDPPPPEEVLRAAQSLFYRDLILIGLIVDHPNLFPDQWIYIHSPQVKVSRIQNFKNWSIGMVPDPMKTSLGMEYFCTEGDGLWMRSDPELVDLATRELIHLGLAKEGEVKEGVVFRQCKAYPVYDRDYRKNLEMIRQFLKDIENLQSIGRNGMHRYNNQDHSMLTAMFAVKNLLGENHDLWGVNVDPSYYEN